ncbi:hypothetical protein [Chitinolyticbacter albus]|uniref:hypothetical protein n=1 Tax=Chitinolyticbacter albus TaxID=2961951 RepID=UPI00210B1ACC|nr:hypothetical protein [Chitinolyticbacter albus]
MSIGIEAHGLIPVLSIFSIIMVMPVKWAAAYVDAGRTDFVSSFVAVVLSAIAAVIVYKLFDGGVLGVLVAFVVMNVVQATTLKIPGFKIPGYFIIAFFLQLAVGFAMATLPFKLQLSSYIIS